MLETLKKGSVVYEMGCNKCGLLPPQPISRESFMGFLLERKKREMEAREASGEPMTVQIIFQSGCPICAKDQTPRHAKLVILK